MLETVSVTVSQLNRYIKSVMDSDYNLRTVFVSGEISNFTNHYRTGHFYMTLKDEKAAVRAVMFKSDNERLGFMPENGMKVIARGHVSVFERDGQYQLYIEDMQPDGAGALSIAFEQLKKKLEAEGLFAQERKRPIPRFPKRVGVVTSPTGAAVRDIINVITRRSPSTQIILCPVQVQGASAAGQISDAIRRFNAGRYADVLIVGRGGGSVEELCGERYPCYLCSRSRDGFHHLRFRGGSPRTDPVRSGGTCRQRQSGTARIYQSTRQALRLCAGFTYSLRLQ